MAKLSLEIVSALRKTALKIQNSSNYEWGHMGACNCGNLAQVITQKSKREIHQHAMSNIVAGDWNDMLNDYCSTSNQPFDDIVSDMIQFGFTAEELIQLEKLSNPEVLVKLPQGVYLRHNVKEDVVIYMYLWADLLEEKIQEIHKLKQVII